MWNGSCHSHAGIRIYGSWHPRSCGHSSAKSWFTSARHERKTRVSNGSTFTSRTSAPCRTVNRKEPIIAETKTSPQEQRNFWMHIRNRFHQSGRSMNRKPNGSEQVIQAHKAFRKTKRTNSQNCSSFPPGCFCFSLSSLWEGSKSGLLIRMLENIQWKADWECRTKKIHHGQ